MAKIRTGSTTIIRLSRHICRLVRRFGAGDLALMATPELATAVTALVVACTAFDLIDDFPGEIDRSFPQEDIDETPGA